MNKTSYREYMQVIEGVCRGRGERAALQPCSSRCKERRRVPEKESGTYVVVLALCCGRSRQERCGLTWARCVCGKGD